MSNLSVTKGSKISKRYEEACLVFDIRHLSIELEQAQLKGTKEQVESILEELEDKMKKYKSLIETTDYIDV